jgi:hypothetical protein
LLSIVKKEIAMKKQMLMGVIAAALTSWGPGSWASEAAEEGHGGHEPTLELGLEGGVDSGSHQNFFAISAAKPIGHTGFKAVVEYADGRHGDQGSNVTSLKMVKELFSVGHVEVGAVAGVAHAVESDKSGNGWVLGAEAAYPLNAWCDAKIEATRFTGVGNLSQEKSNVVQGGVVLKFD